MCVLLSLLRWGERLVKLDHPYHHGAQKQTCATELTLINPCSSCFLCIVCISPSCAQAHNTWHVAWKHSTAVSVQLQDYHTLIMYSTKLIYILKTRFSLRASRLSHDVGLTLIPNQFCWFYLHVRSYWLREHDAVAYFTNPLYLVNKLCKIKGTNWKGKNSFVELQNCSDRHCCILRPLKQPHFLTQR